MIATGPQRTAESSSRSESNCIWNLQHLPMSHAKRHRRWIAAVASINGQITRYVTLNRPETVARLRALLDELIAERCIQCGKFWQVATDKHAASCPYSGGSGTRELVDALRS